MFLTQSKLLELYRKAKKWLCEIVDVDPDEVVDPPVIGFTDDETCYGKIVCHEFETHILVSEGWYCDRSLSKSECCHLFLTIVHETAHWLDGLANGNSPSKRMEWLSMMAECLAAEEWFSLQASCPPPNEDYSIPFNHYNNRPDRKEYAREYLREKLVALLPEPMEV